jgi:peroxiredoxin
MTERRMSAREINESITYTCWAVFARKAPVPDGVAEELQRVVGELNDVTVRGWYDVSGLRADADVMVWLHGPTAEGLQEALRVLRRALGAVELSWSAFGIHRPAEFNKGHVPAFLSGKPAQQWLCVYPFVRSYEWYLLPENERQELLVEHGMMGRDHTTVLSNTVASFALGDWEWVLALEAPDLHEIVDMTRHLRASGARRHVRIEIPFYTGRLISVAEVADVLR